jgi:opacity protein-like surface antigen
MKKVFTILISLALLMSVAIAPVYAAGGQNQGDVGQGTVDQGDSGNEDASPGSDAMGNQV